MAEWPVVPDGFGYPLVDMTTKRLNDPTMEAIAASSELSATIGEQVAVELPPLIEAQVPPLVADAIAADDTVVVAAAAAVDDALLAEDIPTGDDTRVTRLEAWGPYASGGVTQFGRWDESRLGTDGMVPDDVLTAQVRRFDADVLGSRLARVVPAEGVGAQRQPDGTYRRETSKSFHVTAVGDSLTAGTGDDGTGTVVSGGWPARMAAEYTPVTVVNAGVSGRTSTERAIESGAIAPLVTVSGNVVPGGGVATVTAITPGESFRSGVVGGSWSVTGTIGVGGVAATLTRDQSQALQTDGWTLTATAGTVVDPQTPFIVTGGLAASMDRDTTLILATGRNNTTGSAFAAALRDARAQVGALKPLRPRVGLLSILTDTAEIAGVNYYDAVAQANAERERVCEAAGWLYIDVRRYIIDNALDYLTLKGVTPTTDDINRVRNDTIPVSLHAASDNIHLNGLGYDLMWASIEAAMLAEGWL